MNRWSPLETLEAACWSVGILLLFLFFALRATGEWELNQAIASFGEARAAANPPQMLLAGGATDPFADEGVVPFSENGGPDSAPSLETSAAAASAPDSGESSALPVALLRIPRIDLEVPVFADTTERNLNRGAGWIEGTAAPESGGNFGIAAHRDAHFRPLKDVAVGDVLEVESLHGARKYEVTGITIVDPEDVSPLDPTDTATVTLVTCYPFYFIGNAPQRYIVRATSLD